MLKIRRWTEDWANTIIGISAIAIGTVVISYMVTLGIIVMRT